MTPTGLYCDLTLVTCSLVTKKGGKVIYHERYCICLQERGALAFNTKEWATLSGSESLRFSGDSVFLSASTQRFSSVSQGSKPP